jgi:hypothetical protein
LEKEDELMKVWLGGKIYDSETEPIILKLSEEEKKHVYKMPCQLKHYLSAPGDSTEEERLKWIDTAIKDFNRND